VRVLLDTCVLSEIRRPKGHPRVRGAVAALDSEDMFVSVVSIGEIAKGIALLKDTKKKDDLRGWIQALEADYADRIW
jgi:toxin FitB